MNILLSMASSQSLLRKFKAGFPDAPHIRKEGDGIRFDYMSDTGTRWMETTIDDNGLQGMVFAKAKIGINRYQIYIPAPVTVAQVKEIHEWLNSKARPNPPYTSDDSPKNTVRAYNRKRK